MAWALEDYVVTSHARLAPLGDFLAQLLAAVRKVFEVLWPETAAPTSGLQLVEWLAMAPGRVDEWRASAALAGAEMALSFVLSWYDEVRLDQLATH
jgi:hypothetical protein